MMIRFRPPSRLAPALITALILLFTLTSIAVHGDEDQEPARLPGPGLLDCESDDCPGLFALARRGGYLGVELTSLSADLRAHFNAPSDAGVMVGKIAGGSPAADAGLQVGDIITGVDGEPVASGNALSRIVRRTGNGEHLTLDIVRNATPLQLTVTIVERERTAIDLGAFLPGEGKHLEGLFDDAHWERVGLEIQEAMAGVDWEAIGSSAQAFSSEAMEEAMAGLDKMFQSEEWKEQMKRIEDIDYDALEAQMEALQKRLVELEARLEDRLDDDR